jgi:hypothetical protein
LLELLLIGVRGRRRDCQTGALGGEALNHEVVVALLLHFWFLLHLPLGVKHELVQSVAAAPAVDGWTVAQMPVLAREGSIAHGLIGLSARALVCTLLRLPRKLLELAILEDPDHLLLIDAFDVVGLEV